jgi:hypothetical protein
MIFDRNTRTLYADDGSLIKKVHCPLDLGVDKLRELSTPARNRFCEYCNQEILNIDNLSDEQAQEYLESGTYRCVFATRNACNVRHVSSVKIVQKGLRVIGTARSIGEIEAAVKNGFWPLIKKVEYSEDLASCMAVYQNTKTGEIKCVGDLRYNPQPHEEWVPAVDRFCYYQYHQKVPIAAYLLPGDLMIGEEVVLDDVIEDIVGGQWNQGPTWRKESINAIWNGKDFEYDNTPSSFEILG